MGYLEGSHSVAWRSLLVFSNIIGGYFSLSPSLPPSQDLDSHDRNLVKEGQVFLKNVKKLYQCILFNDLLVFAHGDSRQSIVELQLSLEAVWVEDLEDLDPQTSQCKPV